MRGSKMKLAVDRKSCIGAGQCVSVAESTFDQDDEGIVVLLDEHPSEENQEAAKLAISLCPARAISESL